MLLEKSIGLFLYHGPNLPKLAGCCKDSVADVIVDAKYKQK